eukprot:scpid59854/ scgid28970/ Kanadaptin; Human lung cancer oncogene 3 protein; Kidney anion exchanger adapter protein; Solute carrier family 4 anion exchanger member 1 adapter protein
MSDSPTDLSVVTKTLKLRKPVRKVEEASLDSLAPPSDIPTGDSFQVPSADLLLDPKLKDSRRKEQPNEPTVQPSNDAEKKDEDRNIEETPEEGDKPDDAPVKTAAAEPITSRSPGRPVPYTEPKWSGCPAVTHGLEVIKNGQLLKTIDLSKKPFTVFGRSEQCDVEIEHPSASRYHAVLQCRPSRTHADSSDVDSPGNDEDEDQESDGRDEFYVYDLGSSNNTMVNKEKLKPKTYYRVRLGHQLRFGFSTRLYVLVAGQPDTTAAMIEADAAEEERQVLEERLRKARGFASDVNESSGGDQDTARSQKKSGKIIKHHDDPNAISWGFQEDDVEEEAIMEERPDFEALLSARQGKAQYFEKDPKKALETFFEREGMDMEFETDEDGSGHKHMYIGRVRLPIQTATGAPVYGEGTATKKKDAMAAAALDACRLLDAQGMLREHQGGKDGGRKGRRRDEDFYDSDEDSFLDRTGTAEKKRQKRMEKSGKNKSADGVETYDSLSKKLTDIQSQVKEAEGKLDKAMAAQGNNDGSLEDFMNSIHDRLDRGQRAKLRQTIADLKKEESKLARLVALTAPTKLPELKADAGNSSGSEVAGSPRSESASSPQPKKKPYGFVGVAKRPTGSSGGLRVPTAKPAAPEPKHRPERHTEEVEEEEEEDEDMDTGEAVLTDTSTSGRKDATPSSRARSPSPPSSSERRALPRSVTVQGPPSLPASPPVAATQPATTAPAERAEDGDGEQDGDSESQSKSARRRKRRQRHVAEQSLASAASSVKAAVKEDSLDDWKRDPNVDAWLPPKNQSGDGKTHLNAKFGY